MTARCSRRRSARSSPTWSAAGLPGARLSTSASTRSPSLPPGSSCRPSATCRRRSAAALRAGRPAGPRRRRLLPHQQCPRRRRLGARRPGPILRHLWDDFRFQASTAAMLIGLSPVVIVSADFSPLLLLSCCPWGRLPRRLAGRAERPPGPARRPHRAAQPAFFRCAPSRRCARRATRHALGRHGHGPRPLQGGQRHARPPHRRPAPARGRPRLQAALRGRHPSPGSAVTSSRSCSPVDGVADGASGRRTIREAFASRSLEGARAGRGGSIGIACYPDHGQTSTRLIQHADVAMYMAKQTRRGVAVVYDARWRSSAPTR